jgi:hypothetical protein
MFFIRFLILISLLIIMSSCSVLRDFLAPDNLMPSLGIKEVKDPITEEIKYTSEKISQNFEERKPTFIPAKNNQFQVMDAIKLNPFIIKTKSDFEYYLQLSVIGPQGLVTNELMLRCLGKPFFSHRIAQREQEGINVLQHSFATTKFKSFHYQEEIIETKVTPALFDYLESCASDILIRAKGLKASIDSSIQSANQETTGFHHGMAGFKSVVESSQLKKE